MSYEQETKKLIDKIPDFNELKNSVVKQVHTRKRGNASGHPPPAIQPTR